MWGGSQAGEQLRVMNKSLLLGIRKTQGNIHCTTYSLSGFELSSPDFLTCKTGMCYVWAKLCPLQNSYIEVLIPIHEHTCM